MGMKNWEQWYYLPQIGFLNYRPQESRALFFTSFVLIINENENFRHSNSTCYSVNHSDLCRHKRSIIIGLSLQHLINCGCSHFHNDIPVWHAKPPNSIFHSVQLHSSSQSHFLMCFLSSFLEPVLSRSPYPCLPLIVLPHLYEFLATSYSFQSYESYFFQSPSFFLLAITGFIVGLYLSLCFWPVLQYSLPLVINKGFNDHLKNKIVESVELETLITDITSEMQLLNKETDAGPGSETTVQTLSFSCFLILSNPHGIFGFHFFLYKIWIKSMYMTERYM